MNDLKPGLLAGRFWLTASWPLLDNVDFRHAAETSRPPQHHPHSWPMAIVGSCRRPWLLRAETHPVRPTWYQHGKSKDLRVYLHGSTCRLFR